MVSAGAAKGAERGACSFARRSLMARPVSSPRTACRRSVGDSLRSTSSAVTDRSGQSPAAPHLSSDSTKARREDARVCARCPPEPAPSSSASATTSSAATAQPGPSSPTRTARPTPRRAASSPSEAHATAGSSLGQQPRSPAFDDTRRTSRSRHALGLDLCRTGCSPDGGLGRRSASRRRHRLSLRPGVAGR